MTTDLEERFRQMEKMVQVTQTIIDKSGSPTLNFGSFKSVGEPDNTLTLA